MISCPAMVECTILTAKRIQGELKEHGFLMMDEPVGYRQTTKADDWNVGKFIFPVTSTQGGSAAGHQDAIQGGGTGDLCRRVSNGQFRQRLHP